MKYKPLQDTERSPGNALNKFFEWFLSSTKLRIPASFFWGLMVLLLLLAIFRSFLPFESLELSVIASDSGSAPALCIIHKPVFMPSKAIVVLPGDNSSAYAVLAQLKEQGCSEIDTLLIVDRAKSIWAAQKIIEQKKTATILLFEGTRQSKNKKSLKRLCQYEGMKFQQISHNEEKETRFSFNWKVSNEKLDKWELVNEEKNIIIKMNYNNNGILELICKKEQKIIFEENFPKQNKYYTWTKQIKAGN